MNQQQHMILCLSIIILATAPIAFGTDDGFIAHWKLNGDARDSSGHNLHAENHGVKFQPTAQFDGRGAHLKLKHNEQLDLGTDEFSISVRVRIPEQLDDLPGNILSKFDPVTRNGFQLAIESRPRSHFEPVQRASPAFRDRCGTSRTRMDRSWTTR